MKLVMICLSTICLAGLSSIVAQSFDQYGAALIDRSAHRPS